MEYLKQIHSAISDMRQYPLLTRIQKKALFKRCPACGNDYLHAVGDDDDAENYLWCNACDLSMDSDGGYTN